MGGRVGASFTFVFHYVYVYIYIRCLRMFMLMFMLVFDIFRLCLCSYVHNFRLGLCVRMS